MSLEPGLPAPTLDAARLSRIDDALARHGMTRCGEPLLLPNSVVNENFRVPADQRDVVVRIHFGKPAPGRLELERRAILFAGEHEIPVRPPLVAPDGKYFHSIGGLLVSVYPWLDATIARRGSISQRQAATMGDVQGRIHVAFRNFDDAGLPTDRDDANWDTEKSIADLSRVDDLIRYYPVAGDKLRRIQDQLRFKLELLESGAARPRGEFDSLQSQPVHGDYHDGNILLGANDTVLAVIDWELVRRVPPVLELLRSVTFSRLLEPQLLRAYLEAYARHRRLSPEECGAGAEMWWQSLLHTTWIYVERFIRGSHAVDHFFPDNAATTRQFADPEFRRWLTAQLLAFTTG